MSSVEPTAALYPAKHARLDGLDKVAYVEPKRINSLCQPVLKFLKRLDAQLCGEFLKRSEERHELLAEIDVLHHCLPMLLVRCALYDACRIHGNAQLIVAMNHMPNCHSSAAFHGSQIVAERFERSASWTIRVRLFAI
jgi:hypothetical protein